MSEISNLPRHIAIIVDGNRRWAKAHNLQPWEGHIRSVKVIEDISRTIVDLGIEYATFWGGSYNNLTKRTPLEIKFLDEKMYRVWAKKALEDKDVHEKGVRVRFIGEWPSLLSPETQKAISEVETATKDYSNYNFTYLVGYNGDREMISAINSAIKDGKEVTGETIKNYLWTKDLPQVDLVIRTGEENPTMPHNSTGFMMWHTKDSIMHYLEKGFPDFTKENLKDSIERYSQRERRFGK
ncbi:di-trans,poly-cis-decaprenylcistransferase [Patescibacteria group bacterium]|nr:di-trans,poly-cis-decaprenylcistransferase [Patescibacteria group bacterium]